MESRENGNPFFHCITGLVHNPSLLGFVVLHPGRTAQRCPVTAWPTVCYWDKSEPLLARCEPSAYFSFYSFPIALLVPSRLMFSLDETRIKPYPGKNKISFGRLTYL